MAKRGNDTTGASFVDFWEYVISKGLMKPNTARSLGAVARAVLSVEPNWQAIDVRSLDVAEVIRRFKNLRARDYTPESLGTYERRFQLALNHYIKYLEDPKSWKGPSARRSAGVSASKKRGAAEGADLGSETNGSAVENIPTNARFVTYPFPLRDGFIAQLRLPADLTAADVERLTAFMKSLVIGGQQ